MVSHETSGISGKDRQNSGGPIGYSETLSRSSAVSVNGGITEWFATINYGRSLAGLCIIAITVQHIISGSCTCQSTSIPGYRRCDLISGYRVQTEQPALR